MRKQENIRLKPGNYIVFLIYSLMAFMVLIGFIPFKYIFSFDIVPIVNNNPMNLFYGMTIPIYGGNLPLGLLSTIIPTSIFQNILLFFILAVSGYSMHLLAGRFTDSGIGRFYAGFLYAFNPYSYSRLITGQWLISYALLPFLLYSFIDLVEKRNRKEMIKFVFLLTLVSANIHILAIAIAVLIIIFLFWFYEYRKTDALKWIIAASVLFIILNSFWIIPLFNEQKTILDSIGEKDFEAFAPKGGLFDIASMYGFWNEGYLNTRDFLPGWEILYLIILFLTITGFIFYYKDKKLRSYLLGFAVIGLTGFILANGINGPFGNIMRWLFENTMLKAFRDSHKFVAMLVLSYSVLGGLGLNKIENAYQNMSAPGTKKSLIKVLLSGIIFILLITPLGYSFMFFNGFGGQIKATDYPQDWYEANNYLNEDKQNYNILFFPWHLYMDFGWVNNTNKRIVNPAGYFFDKEVIGGTNAEIGELYREINTPDQIYIDSLLARRDNITDFGKSISILNVKYVILAKESDYRKYSFLFQQSDLELVKETKTLYIFKNKNDVLKIYQTDNINDINAEKTALNYEKINPVRYILKDNGNKKYTVFAEPYSSEWKCDGKTSIPAYGVLDAFKNCRDNITFERFYEINLPSYIISILTGTVLIIIYLRPARKKAHLR